mmetsp:Transcript_36502/g.116152  ORF Transcript_36502/g.116152 Transcript_36502/m.116152 type:complete len:334 (+) Transcript_36502:611-1612(+)
MLVRVSLEVRKGAVHRGSEQRHAADGVVEGRLTLELREQHDVRRLVEELRLGIDLGAVVAADCLGQTLVRIHAHRHVRRCAAGDVVAQPGLHGALAGVHLGRRPAGHRGAKARQRGRGRHGGDGLHLQVRLPVGALGPELDALDGLQGLGRGADARVLGAARRLLARRRAPLVAEAVEGHAHGNEVAARGHRELCLEATAAEGDGAPARAGVGRAHGARGEGHAEALVAWRGAADHEDEVAFQSAGGVREGAVRGRLDEARRLQARHVNHLAVEDPEVPGGVHLPGACGPATHHRVVELLEREGRPLRAVKGCELHLGCCRGSSRCGDEQGAT